VGQAKHSKSNISKCHFIQHRSHIDRAGIELGHLGWEYKRVLNEPHTIRIIAEKTAHSTLFCLASQHCRQPSAPHCLRQNVSRRCDTATSCNYQQFKRLRQLDLNNITSNIQVKIIDATPQSPLQT